MMSRWFAFGRTLTLMSALALFAGCEQKGPAGDAGQAIDDTASDVGNALDPRGPAEKAGDSVDDAFGN